MLFCCSSIFYVLSIISLSIEQQQKQSKTKKKNRTNLHSTFYRLRISSSAMKMIWGCLKWMCIVSSLFFSLTNHGALGSFILCVCSGAWKSLEWDRFFFLLFFSFCCEICFCLIGHKKNKNHGEKQSKFVAQVELDRLVMLTGEREFEITVVSGEK